jgi:hypothetical protein
MWSQQHSQWLDLPGDPLGEVLVRYPMFFVARGVVDLTRLPILAHDDLSMHRHLC